MLTLLTALLLALTRESSGSSESSEFSGTETGWPRLGAAILSFPSGVHVRFKKKSFTALRAETQSLRFLKEICKTQSVIS